MSTRPSSAAQSPQPLSAVVHLSRQRIEPSKHGTGMRSARRKMHPARSGRRQTALIASTLCASTLCLALSAGCGGQPRRAPEVDPSAAATTPAPQALPAQGAFYTEGRPTYAGDTRLSSLGVEQQIAVALASPLQPPPALDCVAREYAARFAADQRTPPPRVVDAFAVHCGLWALPADTYAVTGKITEQVIEHLRQVIAQKQIQGPGLGVIQGPGDQITAALVTLPPSISLTAVPRTAAPGEAVEIRGRLLRGEGPLMALAGPLSDAQAKRGVVEVPVRLDAEGRFAVDWTVPEGAYRGSPHVDLEILKIRGRFLEPVARIRLAPTAADAYPAAEAPTPARTATPEIIRGEFTQALNDARRLRGLPTLSQARHLSPLLDDWLARLGAGQADLEPPQITDAAGQPYANVRYTFASGVTGAAALAALLDRPHGQRALLGDEDAVAVGVRPFPRGEGADLVVLTVSRFAAAGVSQIRGDLLSGLNASRAAADRAPLLASPSLEAAAQAVAEKALLGEIAWPTVIDEIMKRAPAAGAGGAVGAGAFTVDKIAAADFSQEPNALAPQVKHVGIGVATGPLPGGGPPRILVVYLVSEAAPAQP